MLAIRAGELAVVIAGWFLALRVWNLSRISPLTALLALFTRHAPRTWLLSTLRLLGGAVIAFAALLLLSIILDGPERGEFSAFAIVTFLTALAADFLLGLRLRA